MQSWGMESAFTPGAVVDAHWQHSSLLRWGLALLRRASPSDIQQRGNTIRAGKERCKRLNCRGWAMSLALGIATGAWVCTAVFAEPPASRGRGSPAVHAASRWEHAKCEAMPVSQFLEAVLWTGRPAWVSHPIPSPNTMSSSPFLPGDGCSDSLVSNVLSGSKVCKTESRAELKPPRFPLLRLQPQCLW